MAPPCVFGWVFGWVFARAGVDMIPIGTSVVPPWPPQLFQWFVGITDITAPNDPTFPTVYDAWLWTAVSHQVLIPAMRNVPHSPHRVSLGIHLVFPGGFLTVRGGVIGIICARRWEILSATHGSTAA